MTNQGTDQPWGLKWIGHPAFILGALYKVNAINRMMRELPDEGGNEATFLQGLGEIALPCYLLFKESKHNTSYNLVERNSITMFNLNPI